MQNTALSVAWSPTGDRLAVVQGGTQYTAQILTWPGLIEQTTFPLAQPAQELSIFEVYWSPDGDQLASSQPYAVHVRDSATGRVINSLDMNRSNLDIILDIAWHSDGRTLYVLTQIGSVRLWDTVENEVIDEFRTLEFPTSMAISADGSYLAIGHSGHDLQILDAITGEIITNLEIEGTTADVVWRPYTNQISTVVISADGEQSISTWDTQNGQRFETIPLPPGARVLSMAYSTYGATLVYYSVGIGTSLHDDPSVHSISKEVPNPSRNQLINIQSACGLEGPVVPDLLSIPDINLNTYIENITALAGNDIPPACTTDLIAVAEALQVEE